jgi:hypothetical protein
MITASCARAAGALALAALSLAAQAQVNKCPQADGSVSYQSTPCGVGEARTERVSAAQLNAAQRAREARARAASAPHAASHPRAARPPAAARCPKTSASASAAKPC